MSQTIVTAVAVIGMLAANAVFFASFVSLAVYRARKEGFERGVIDGWLVGRFPKTSYVDRRLKAACAITDRLEADVMWADLNKSHERNASNEGQVD